MNRKNKNRSFNDPILEEWRDIFLIFVFIFLNLNAGHMCRLYSCARVCIDTCTCKLKDLKRLNIFTRCLTFWFCTKLIWNTYSTLQTQTFQSEWNLLFEHHEQLIKCLFISFNVFPILTKSSIDSNIIKIRKTNQTQLHDYIQFNRSVN